MTAFLLAGCRPGDATEWSGTVETLPGGGQLVRNPAAGVWESREASGWRLEEELRIGDVEGDGPEAFGSVRGVFVDPWDRIHVIDGQANDIRVFAENGTFVRVIGRPVFDVFDSEGRYLGAVDAGRTMTRVTPVIRGDRFYAVVRDSLDIPFVVRYRIAGRDLLH